jgi:hypothetical protein
MDLLFLVRAGLRDIDTLSCSLASREVATPTSKGKAILLTWPKVVMIKLLEQWKRVVG